MDHCNPCAYIHRGLLIYNWNNLDPLKTLFTVSGDDDKKDGAGPGATGGGGASSGGGGGSSGGGGASGAAGGSTGGNEGTSSEPSSSSGGGSKAEGTTDGEEAKKDDKELSFAERYAGPEGTTVTIKAAPQGPFMFPGMEGPSVSIRNPGGGKSPEAVVNFPMPPALQLLQHLLRSAAEDVSDESGSGEEDGEDKATGERKEGVASSKETTGDDSKKGAEGGEPKPKKKKKKKRPKTPSEFVVSHLIVCGCDEVFIPWRFERQVCSVKHRVSALSEPHTHVHV